jgi:competence protein ComEA
MNFLILLLLGGIAFLLTRLQFLLTAQRDDLADLRQQISQLRSEIRLAAKAPAAPAPAATPQKKPASISEEQLQSATERININTISKNGLQKIPGVGAACAQRVIDARPYHNLAQLDALDGLTKAQRQQLKQHLTV